MSDVDHLGRGFISTDPNWPVEKIIESEPPQHIMLDLETLDTADTAVILSIGAVKFDPNGTELGESFYVAIDPRGQTRYGRTMSAETVLWWMDPKQDEIRRAMLNEEKTDLSSALYTFESWYSHCPPYLRRPPIASVWGNGSNFDNVILRSAYASVGQPCPFDAFHDRCFRTLKSINSTKSVEPTRENAHHALADAQHQAHWVQAIVRNFMRTPAF